MRPGQVPGFFFSQTKKIPEMSVGYTGSISVNWWGQPCPISQAAITAMFRMSVAVLTLDAI